MKLLWIDNDYMTPFNPLSKRLERKGFFLIKIGNYEEALDFINQADFDDIETVLLDVIIPANSKCLSYAGFEIAREIAAKHSVQRIAFLSVVLRDEIKDKYNSLKKEFATEIELKYIDKAQLLEPPIFNELINFLKNSNEESTI